jgi:hypothetical protein
MAWEYRGGGRYYYTSQRRGGKVAKVYHGKDVFGEMAAAVLAEARLRRGREAEALAAERARLEPVERATKTLDDACRLMVEAALIADGYHNHEGHWRRRRVRRENGDVAEAAGRG